MPPPLWTDISWAALGAALHPALVVCLCLRSAVALRWADEGNTPVPRGKHQRHLVKLLSGGIEYLSVKREKD